MAQKNILKILFIEDVPSDVELAVHELRKEKLIFEYTTVCSGQELVKALSEFKPDLIISDFMMPAFNGMQALKLVRELEPDLPFILFTGSINEETAVECIKEGARDYVIKEHLTRLPFAVKEAIEQVRINKEKRASELLLRENEEKLQSIFRVAPVGIALLVNRLLIEVNDALCEMTGYERSELIGESSEILYSSGDEFDRAGNEKYTQISEKGTAIFETSFKHRNGRLLNILLSSSALDKNNLEKGVTLIVLDITESKRSEKALRESQMLFQTLSQVSPVGIFRTNAEGRTTYVNPEWLKLSGITSEETIGYSWLKSVHPDDRKKLEDTWASDERNQKVSKLEYRILRPDGTQVWVLGNAVQEWKDEKIAGYICTITDITERKNAEIALRKSEERYRRIFENVQDVYYETSIDGNILEVSPSIKTLSGGQYAMEEILNKSMYQFYADPEKRNFMMEEIKLKGIVNDFEIELINRDGTLMPCSMSAKLIRNTEGRPEKIIGSLRDITDRKNASNALQNAKEKAEASDKLKTDFLNNISHEVRTPLNGILGFAELISSQNLSADETKESALMLFESSNRLLNTITNYMDISLLTSGSLSVNKKYFIPSLLLKKIFSDFESICSNRKLKLILDVPEEFSSFRINTDPELCQKILSHFIDNAIKFTDKGNIRFGFNLINGQLVFYVKDTGIGIGAESFDAIFERFVKVKKGSFINYEGSGLGLSIAKGMAEAIGGTIRLESHEGEGSVFYLTIPEGKSGESIAPEGAYREARHWGTGPLILVAEDDETNFYYLNALITRETGAKVLHASNGRETIDLFRANPDIKLILMDIKMPDIDGFEATKQIKMISDNVVIIAVTAYAMSGDEERIMAAGCDGYLSKPINKKSLMEIIGRLFETNITL